MIKNTFKENWGSASYGLLLKEINDAEITQVIRLNKNTIGINIEGSNRSHLPKEHLQKQWVGH